MRVALHAIENGIGLRDFRGRRPEGRVVEGTVNGPLLSFVYDEKSGGKMSRRTEADERQNHRLHFRAGGIVRLSRMECSDGGGRRTTPITGIGQMWSSTSVEKFFIEDGPGGSSQPCVGERDLDPGRHPFREEYLHCHKTGYIQMKCPTRGIRGDQIYNRLMLNRLDYPCRIPHWEQT